MRNAKRHKHAREQEDDGQTNQTAKAERRERREHDVAAKVLGDRQRGGLRSQGAVNLVDSTNADATPEVHRRLSSRTRHGSMEITDPDRLPANRIDPSSPANESEGETGAPPLLQSHAPVAAAVPPIASSRATDDASESKSRDWPSGPDATRAARDEERELQHSAQDSMTDAAEDEAENAADGHASDERGERTAMRDRERDEQEDEY